MLFFRLRRDRGMSQELSRLVLKLFRPTYHRSCDCYSATLNSHNTICRRKVRYENSKTTNLRFDICSLFCPGTVQNKPPNVWVYIGKSEPLILSRTKCRHPSMSPCRTVRRIIIPPSEFVIPFLISVPDVSQHLDAVSAV